MVLALGAALAANWELALVALQQLPSHLKQKEGIVEGNRTTSTATGGDWFSVIFPLDILGLVVSPVSDH